MTPFKENLSFFPSTRLDGKYDTMFQPYFYGDNGFCPIVPQPPSPAGSLRGAKRRGNPFPSSLHVCNFVNAPGGERIPTTVCALSRNDLRGDEGSGRPGGRPLQENTTVRSTPWGQLCMGIRMAPSSPTAASRRPRRPAPPAQRPCSVQSTVRNLISLGDNGDGSFCPKHLT
jgi:hypothetical protein